VLTDQQRVVVTGMGAVTPVGNDIAAMWANLIAGRSGVGLISSLDMTQLKTKIGAEVKDFDPTLYMERRDARRTDRYTHFALAAAAQAVADAGLAMEGGRSPPRRRDRRLWDRRREHHVRTVRRAAGQRPAARVSPFTVPSMLANSAAGQVAISLGRARAQPGSGAGLRDRHGLHRRGLRGDSPRRGRCDGGRRR
jgi:3-oxoacyl-[acyl-carrier-protein] synthase II